MNLSIKDSKTAPQKTDLLVVFGIEASGAAVPGGLPKGVEVPPLATKAFKGEFREVRLTDAVRGVAARVLQVGLGKPSELTPERLRRGAALAIQKAEKTHAKNCTLWVDGALWKKAKVDAKELGQALGEGLVMGAYSMDTFKSDAKPAHVKRATLQCGDANFRAGARRGSKLGEANCFTRVLQDTPGNLMRPRDMVAAAKRLAARSPRITCKVIDEKAMAKLGMGSLLSVSRGSSEPAYLIHLTYTPGSAGTAKKKPGKKGAKKLCIVGKGLTFDAGGISLKPSAKMDEMKYDMSGGAAILGVFHALGDLQPGVEVHGLVPTSENLPDAKATKPGDIVKAMNGTTIEVLNTDAEGRLILCDSLAYAVKKIKPTQMVDMATLTGAVIVALGHELSGVMGNHQPLIDDLVSAGKETAEEVWPLPLLEVQRKHMKGRVGDLRNINSGQGGGSSAGAAFLSYFVGDTQWAHLDIAGSAWGAESRDYQGGPQGTGVGVRLLTRWIENA